MWNFHTVLFHHLSSFYYKKITAVNIANFGTVLHSTAKEGKLGKRGKIGKNVT